MQNRFDLVVVGAGPAGSTAAKYAAQEGADVLLIDKRKEIGVPVCCGEILPSRSLMTNAFPDAPGLDELFPIDPGLVRRTIRRLVVTSPRGSEYEVPFDGCTVDRDAFDRHLADAAVRSGALLQTETKFLRLDGSKVITSRGTYKAKVVVAADGPLSPVCRSAGMERDLSLSPAITCQVAGEFGDAMRIFFGRLVAPGGYAWIIPKDGRANVGLGVQSRGPPLRPLLNSFLESNGLSGGPMQAGFVPVSGPLHETVRGNVLAVGDAAGHVVASNGGGISIAMICGRIAGLAAARHLQHGEPLFAYEQEWRAAVGRELASAASAKRWMDFSLKSDFLLERAMRVLGSGGIERLIVYNGTGTPERDGRQKKAEEVMQASGR
jgi:digeranylgeranylglycerophospholipid reductase